MSDSDSGGPAPHVPGAEEVPEAEVAARRGPSIVWLVPVIAAVIGGWLWYSAEQEKGPTITISLHTADDIEASKTRVKFKNVELGEVAHVGFADDLSGVVVTVHTNRRARPFLREGTRFWVVRPRIDMRGVSGLGTLVSGAYIEMEPASSGAPSTSFVGLEAPPVAPTDAPGLKLRLLAADLGSLDVGSGVYFRGFQVGQVESRRLAEDKRGVEVDIYVVPEFAPLIRRGTLFWNVSGIQASLGTDGMKFGMQSFDALMRGGIACETPAESAASPAARSGDAFQLHATQADARKKPHLDEIAVVMFFTGSVRGLTVGAPLEFRGIPIGSVQDFWLEYDADTHETRIPVLATIRRGVGRRTDTGALDTPEQDLKGLIDRGLRARLATGSLLTGAIFIDLDMLPDTPVALVGGTDHIELPTIPSTGETLHQALREVSSIIAELRSMVARVDAAAPALIASVENSSVSLEHTLAQATETLVELRDLAAESGKLGPPLKQALVELGDSLRSVRQLVDMLERHPEALIQGKPSGDR